MILRCVVLTFWMQWFVGGGRWKLEIRRNLSWIRSKWKRVCVAKVELVALKTSARPASMLPPRCTTIEHGLQFEQTEDFGFSSQPISPEYPEHSRTAVSQL